MKKIAILYICTGKYTIFWDTFFQSSEKFFLPKEHYQKEYFVFTDAKDILHLSNERVHRIHQKALPWPYITLDRFSIFQKIRTQLDTFDYIYFFNGNMQFVQPITEEILPTPSKPLLMVNHPCFVGKGRHEFTYEKKPQSLAHISKEQGTHYVMGGLNGGEQKAYLSLIDELSDRIEKDKKQGIIAEWHDESHLNRYLVDKYDSVTLLDASYGFAEGFELPYEPKIIIRDKLKYGGHSFLRNEKEHKRFQKFMKRLLNKTTFGLFKL